MTRDEHLLVILMEECAEIAKEASKALRFGIDHINPEEDGMTNRTKMTMEIAHLTAIFEMVGVYNDQKFFNECCDKKRDKVEKFIEYSKQCGTLQ